MTTLDEAYGYAPIARYGLTTEIEVYSTARHTCPKCPWTYDQGRPLETWWEHWRAEHSHRDPEPPPALSREEAARLAAIRIERERRR